MFYVSLHGIKILFLFNSSVTGSMSPGSTSQILARKKRRGVSGLELRADLYDLVS